MTRSELCDVLRARIRQYWGPDSHHVLGEPAMLPSTCTMHRGGGKEGARHLLWMLNTCEKMEDEEKFWRWIAWIQGVLCTANYGLTIAECRQQVREVIQQEAEAA